MRLGSNLALQAVLMPIEMREANGGERACMPTQQSLPNRWA
jgi:hypothetical protein